MRSFVIIKLTLMNIRGRKKRKELALVIEKGRELLADQREEEAFAFLKDAVKKFPDNAEVRLLYASILLSYGIDDVAAEASRAVELAPDDPIILVRAGHLLVNRGDREAARSCAARANEVVQPDFVLMSGLVHLDGVLAALDGEDKLAEEKLRSATASEPDNESWARQLAVFLAERGRLADAVEIIDEALKYVEDKTRMEQMRVRMKREIADLQ